MYEHGDNGEVDGIIMDKYKNILVNALVNLGDVVLTTGAIALLKKAYPKARITILVKPVVREAVENNPVIDDVIVFAYKPKENSWGQMMDMVKEIKRRQFDLCLSLDRKLRPALLAFLARIPERVGPDRVFGPKKSRVTWLYTKTIRMDYDLERTLQADTYQNIVRGLTGQSAEEKEKPVFARITAEAKMKAECLLAQLPQAEKIIALCVKGTFPLKTWPKEYFAKVVESLAAEYKASFFVTGGPGDREYADEVIACCQVPVANFCGETNLVELAALFKKCDLLVSVDTGGGHIAATSKVPMVVMYGCTSPDRWYPINENARVLTSREDCCPCTVRAEQCPSWPSPKCLWNVSPEDVLEECRGLLR